jgi:hypothetical protein
MAQGGRGGECLGSPTFCCRALPLFPPPQNPGIMQCAARSRVCREGAARRRDPRSAPLADAGGATRSVAARERKDEKDFVVVFM